MTAEERIAYLREHTINTTHKKVRIAMPDGWDCFSTSLCIAERKATVTARIFDEMPLYIGEHELIVGTRTVYGHKNEEHDKSELLLRAMPHYLPQQDIDSFSGYNGEFYTKAHYTADYGIILEKGIDGIISETKASLASQTSPIKKGWLRSVLIAYQGLSRLIERYSLYAEDMATCELNTMRKSELLQISDICEKISHSPPDNFQEACQLFWFAHLALTVENFCWMNYGRVDSLLYPFYHTVSAEHAELLVKCLLLKMYDYVDIKDDDTGTFAAQHNITIGGVDTNGNDSVNELTFAFIKGIKTIRLPEPEVSCRVSLKNPKEYLAALSELSINGINCLAYYNDDIFVANLIDAGIPPEAARNYGFDLCQDINIPGKGDFYLSHGSDLGVLVFLVLKEYPESFESFMEILKERITTDINKGLSSFNSGAKAIIEYVNGNKDYFREEIKAGRLLNRAMAPLMSPLPLTSGLFHGCVEKGIDLSWFGCELPDKGAFIANPVVGINGLAAIKRCVYDSKQYSIQEVHHACETNFEGNEKLRLALWNAPKWCNDDDYVDLIAKDVLEFGCNEILKHTTARGGRHLCGVHQPHPVFYGRELAATPEGRKRGEPIPVTLSPENGSMYNGPTAAFKSVAKLDPGIFQWNNCVMLQYFSSVFEDNDGIDTFTRLIKGYFALGGTQHQPNIVNLADLRAAQKSPELYKDLIVRMWGVSAHFVDLPRDVQDEFIERFENIAI